MKSVQYLSIMRKSLKIFEIFVCFVAIILAVYGKIDNFNASHYGFKIKTIKSAITQNDNQMYIHLQDIPSIESVGIITEQNIVYNILMSFSQIVAMAIKHLQLFIAIAAVIIIRIKYYLNNSEKNNNT